MLLAQLYRNCFSLFENYSGTYGSGSMTEEGLEMNYLTMNIETIVICNGKMKFYPSLLQTLKGLHSSVLGTSVQTAKH